MSAAEQIPEQIAALVTAAVERALANQTPAKRNGRKATKDKTLAESCKVNNHSPMLLDDRVFLDEYDWEANLDANRAQARELLKRITVGTARPERDPAGAGTCEECGNDGPWREVWGTFTVCAGCASRRHLAALRVAA
jgi:RNA polymerase-binding transcription factor DksA